MSTFEFKSISDTEIRKGLETFIKALPDYAAKWKDFYEGGAGQTVLTVGAGLTSFLALNASLNRKNSFLDYGVLSTSIVNIANSLGFLYNTSCCPRLQFTFNSPAQRLYKKEEILGNYKSFNICLLEDTLINEGENTLQVGIGDWNKTTLTIEDTNDFYGFFIEIDIDNNYYHFYLNDNEIEVTKLPEDLNENNLLIRKYKNGFYIISGNGYLGKKLSPQDKIVIDYITPAPKLDNAINDVNQITLALANDNNNTPTSVSTLDYGSDPDSDNKLIALSPGYHFSKRLLISPGDYEYIGGAYQGMVSCSAIPEKNKCCSALVAYLRADEKLLTDTQSNEFKQYLLNLSTIGTQITLIDPKRIRVDVGLKILLSNTNVDIDNIRNELENKLNLMCFTLGGMFSPGTILNLDIDGVKRIYLDKPITDKQANYDEYFKLNSLNIQFETNDLIILQSGTDISAGYYNVEAIT